MKTIEDTLKGLAAVTGGPAPDAPRRGVAGVSPFTPEERTVDAWVERSAWREHQWAEAAKQPRKKRKRKQKRAAATQKAAVSGGNGGRTAKSEVPARGVLKRYKTAHGASKRLFVDWLREHPWSTQAEIKAGLEGKVPRGSIRAYCTNGKRDGYVEARTREMGRLWPGGEPRPIAEYRIKEGPAAGVRPSPLRAAGRGFLD